MPRMTEMNSERTDAAPNHAPRRRALMLAIAGIVLLGPLAGCEPPLLRPTDDRSPFDRYDGIRNQRAAPFVEDEFGTRRPNLRGRLQPKE